MSIRLSLLAILDQGPCYGNQLRLEFERRTGGSWPLNAGQVYATLDRLERDGLAAKGATDAAGHIYYSITPEGSAGVASWLAAATEPTRSEFAMKLSLAVTLPGADAAALIDAQRQVTSAALDRYRAEPTVTLARQLVVDSLVFAAEAELRWLDHVERRLPDAQPFGLDAEPPRRGRPTRG
jgi:DNA-binding PadR family transcriptional regulator